MDLKDDTTEMSTVVKTDSSAFAKSKLGSKRFDSELRQGACWVLPPDSDSAPAPRGEWALEFTSKVSTITRGVSSLPGPQWIHL